MSSRFKVFVGGLSQQTTKDSLTAHFSQHGPCHSYVMLDSSTGRSRGFGFVNFEDERSYHDALSLAHEVDGSQISVAPYADKSGGRPPVSQTGTSGASAKAAAAPTASETVAAVRNLLVNHLGGQQESASSRPSKGVDSLKIFVGGLAQETTKESLNRHFSQYGRVDSYVMLDSRTGRSRGFGFVNFADEQAKAAALRAPHHEVDGIIISASQKDSQRQGGSSDGHDKAQALSGALGTSADTVRELTSALHTLQEVLQGQQHSASSAGDWSWGTPTGEVNCKVYIGGLPQRTTATSLRAAFRQYSPLHCEVIQDKATGRSRGFGFVTFASPLDVQMVLLTSHVIDGKTVELSECKAKDQTPRPSSSLKQEALDPLRRRSTPY
mmetsp:Transcript_66629/g.124360  ORF Transcript_66629/g.124360 Transcript_66629/m.124360 type:complete len:382 (+) Transcript_66629:121-1266(+)